MSLFGKKEKEEIAAHWTTSIVKSKIRVKNSLVSKKTLKAATAS